MSSPSDALDRAIAQARDLRIDDEYVRSRSEELVRWSRRAEAEARERSRRVWRWGAALGLAATAAVAIAVLSFRGRSPGAGPIVQIGARVAISTAPGTRYTVVRSADDRTEIAVAAGAVTARLYPGASPHHLSLRAGPLEAVATGTIYTVAAPEGGGPYAQVHEGRIEVRDALGNRVLEAGQRWPLSAPRIAAVERSVAQLQQHTLSPSGPSNTTGRDASARDASGSGGMGSGAPGSAAGSGDPDSASGSGTGRVDPGSAASSGDPGNAASSGDPGIASGSGAPSSAAADRIGRRGSGAPPSAGSAVPTVADRWQRARQLRGQGHTREALALLDELSATGDATWAPLALVESIRIHSSVLGDTGSVVRLAQSFLSRFPSHALSREVTEMLCRAHRERGDTELPSACLLR